jgi:hypothetical protein
MAAILQTSENSETEMQSEESSSEDQSIADNGRRNLMGKKRSLHCSAEHSSKKSKRQSTRVDAGTCFQQVHANATLCAAELVAMTRARLSDLLENETLLQHSELAKVLATNMSMKESERLSQSCLNSVEHSVFRQLIEPLYEFCVAFNGCSSTIRVLCRPRDESDESKIKVFFFDRIRSVVQVMWSGKHDDDDGELVNVAFYYVEAGKVLVAAAYLFEGELPDLVSDSAVNASVHYFPMLLGRPIGNANDKVHFASGKEIFTVPCDALRSDEDRANVKMWLENFPVWQPTPWAKLRNRRPKTVYKHDTTPQVVAPLIATDADYKVEPSYPRICATSAILIDALVSGGGENNIASAVVSLFGDRLCVTNDSGNDLIYLWGGQVFHNDEKSLHELIQVATLRLLQNRIAQLNSINDDKDARFEALFSCYEGSLLHFHCDQSLRKIVSLMKKNVGIETVPSHAWNSAPHSIAVLNGVLEFVKRFDRSTLSAVEVVFRYGRLSDNFNQRLPVPWLGDSAQCARFEQYFREVLQKPKRDDSGQFAPTMQRDFDKERIVARYLGSALIRMRFDAFLLVLIGNTASGKSVLQNCISDLFYPSAGWLSNNSSVGALVDKRIIFANDATTMHRGLKCFNKFATFPRVVLNTNFLPKFDDASALQRYILTVRFNMTYVATSKHDVRVNVDPASGQPQGHVRYANGELHKVLLAELPGVLRFLVENCRDYMFEGGLGEIPTAE